MRPPRSLGDRPTRVLLAVIQDPHPSIRRVARTVGVSSMTALHDLRKLRSAGLVDWEPGPSGAGTLRATVRIVAMGGRR